ncbi:MAG: M23 family metallopeptidase [Lachnospiraceae bacterium]|nr:M23 family metallopeptidase [Lachnospiraceae bacterium]
MKRRMVGRRIPKRLCKKLNSRGFRRVTYMLLMFAVYFLLMMVAPSVITKGNIFEAYYVVTIEDKVLGTVRSEDIANEALLKAKKMVSEENKGQNFLEVDMTIYRQDKLTGDYTSEEVLLENIYNEIKDDVFFQDKPVYVMDIDGKEVVLETLDEVQQLLTVVKNQYDADGLFEVKICVESDRDMSFSCQVVKKEQLKEDNDIPQLSAPEDEQTEDGEERETEETVVGEDGMKSISFCEDVKIVASIKSADKVMTLEEAVSEVTTEKDDHQIYEVVAGDSLYKIAKNFGLKLSTLLEMNSHIDENDYLQIGDLLTVMVPVPELSVEYKEQKSYTENYSLPVKYIYDDSKYSTYSSVVTKAVKGVRDVVAIVTYVNGQETEREIIAQEVTKEAVAKVVKVGTKTPPTYVKPITGGKVTSKQGWRTIFGERNYHKGVDWGIPTGTSVRASATGTVIEAGWGGSYGYYVLIKHADGSKTRYAHLSKILVKKGQKVKQNEKIALSGNTGRSTGPHLHFELIINGQTVNPLKYIK